MILSVLIIVIIDSLYIQNSTKFISEIIVLSLNFIRIFSSIFNKFLIISTAVTGLVGSFYIMIFFIIYADVALKPLHKASLHIDHIIIEGWFLSLITKLFTSSKIEGSLALLK